MSRSRRLLEPGEVLLGRWEIVRLLAEGGFGSVYLANDKRTNIPCAIKAEAIHAPRAILKMEVTVLRELSQTTRHACQLLGTGRIEGRTNFIVMTLLGKSLHELRRERPNRYFQPATVARLTIECLESIEALHEIGFVHRDIKPANFATGLTKSIMHLIDFGLARRYRSRDGKTMAYPRQNVGFRGTIRYASVTAHLGQELGRRDDVWSLMYVLVECRKGWLPWTNERDEKKVLQMKRMYGRDVTLGMENEYQEMANQVLQLTYYDQPNYDAYYRMIRLMIEQNRYKPSDQFD